MEALLEALKARAAEARAFVALIDRPRDLDARAAYEALPYGVAAQAVLDHLRVMGRILDESREMMHRARAAASVSSLLEPTA